MDSNSPITQPPIPQPNRGIDIHEQEKRPPQQRFQRRLVHDIREDPMLTPPLRDKLQQRVDIGKRQAPRAALVRHRGEQAFVVELLLLLV